MESSAYGMPRSGWLPTQNATSDRGETCAVTLIDRRTGTTHRVNGRALTMLTRRPLEAVAELLSGRDASVWEARVEVIGQPGGRA